LEDTENLACVKANRFIMTFTREYPTAHFYCDTALRNLKKQCCGSAVFNANPDPDPAFSVSVSDPDPVADPGFDDGKFTKIYS
jgi:hypothetical protein